jgi:hypothetical protein
MQSEESKGLGQMTPKRSTARAVIKDKKTHELASGVEDGMAHVIDAVVLVQPLFV